MNILEIRDLNKYFIVREDKEKIKKHVLKNINLKVSKNESIGIIGNSGSGKTTLIKAIFGLEPINEGKILFENKDISKCTKSEKNSMYKNMGLVMQDPYSSLCPYMRVKDIISEPLKIHKEKTKNVYEHVLNILKKIHLSELYMNKYPSELSGGERQRVAIGRAICINPSLLVLDEPTSMIDTKSKSAVLDLINELKIIEKMSTIIVSHDINTVLNNCDKVVVIKEGSIIEVQQVNDIKKKPLCDYTKELILASTNLKSYWNYLNAEKMKQSV